MAKDKAKDKKAAKPVEAKGGKPASRAAAKVAEKLAAGTDLYSGYKDKAPSALQARFADWLISKLSMEFSSKKEEAAFREGVRLAVALRIPFQASPENQAANAAAKSEPKAKKAKAPKGEVGPTPEDTAQAVEEQVSEEKPAKAEAAPAKKAPAKKAPAKKVAAAAEPATEAVTESTGKAPAKRQPARKAATGAKAPF